MSYHSFSFVTALLYPFLLALLTQDMIRLLHGGAPSAPPPSKSEQVANQPQSKMRKMSKMFMMSRHMICINIQYFNIF